MKFKNPYERKQSQGLILKNGRTKQSFRDDSNINNIIKKYNETGLLPDLIKKEPQYGDFAKTQDFQSSLNLVIKAQEQFDALSATVRKRFNNDPAEMLAFVNDKRNQEELVKLGLATKRPVPKEQVAPARPSETSPAPNPGQAPKGAGIIAT